MAGVASGRLGDSRPYDGVLTRQESSEWRTSEQLENGTPSTSSFWDTDDDGCGQRPSELYGKYTWKIHKFSKINKRELRSDAFEVGGYKWYILMYPQGCDVCNHLSLFLCVANHDKLLPGWSHFAQFTIAVVNNKDIKKSKHSDTLHRFCKKEHDWGWKKFIELSKVVDGFIDTDTLTIEAEVQVIRERADRPFRCLTCKYRRELVCVYLSNVEQICHQFVEERRSKLGNFLEDKARWSSFCAFWLRIDQKTRRSLTREKTDSVLRVIVKHFFVEKEVTSTLVMDSLFSGLKTLEGQIKTNKGWRKLMGTDKLPVPVVRVEQEMFVVVDDVLLLLERAALDPLPSTDNKGPQNRMEDGSSGDDSSKGSIVSDERRLTELGRRTIEIFVLSHIFSKIEVAYQEAVALKRQEELIREEAAWLETEQKSKRGAAEKEKKSKKKLGKQKRNNRKGKDKGRDDYAIDNAMDKFDLESLGEGKDSMGEQAKPELVEPETFEDVSDVSDTIDRVTEVVHPDSEERESSPVNWDTDTFKVGGVTSALSSVQNGIRETNGLCTVVDDSSSTCSTDSVPSVVMNESLGSSSRKWKQRGRATSDMFGWVNEGSIRSSNARSDVAPLNGSYGSRKTESEPDPATESLLDQIKKRNQHVVKGQVAFHRTEPSIKHQADTQRPPKEKTSSSSPISSFKSTTPPILPKLEAKITAPSTNISIKRPLSDIPQLAPHVRNSADMAVSARFEPRKPLSPPKPTIRSLTQEVPVMPRPLSAPIVPGPRPSTPVVSMVQSKPLISRSVSAVGRLGLDPTLVSHLHQSNSNVTMGTNIFTPSTSTSSAYAQPQSPSIAFNLLQHYPTPANVICPPMFGVVNRPSMQNDSHAPDLYKQVHSRSLYSLPTGSQACKSGRQTHSVLTDEFPHLDIINDLLDDEYGTADIYAERKTSVSPHFHRQFSYHGDIGMTNDMLVGPSTSPCRFGQSHSSHEPVFQPSYTRDFFTQQNLRPPPNGQTQWQVAGSDSSYLNTMTLEGGGNPYYNPDYPNLAVNSNGYTVFRPSNGQ